MDRTSSSAFAPFEETVDLVLWTTRWSAMPSVASVGARTRYLTPDAAEAAAHPPNDGITFIRHASGSAAYLADLLASYVSRATS